MSPVLSVIIVVIISKVVISIVILRIVIESIFRLPMITGGTTVEVSQFTKLLK
jgi:hypothetical protein